VKKSVIFSLLDTPAYGGAEEYLLTALECLRQDGHPIVVATNNREVRDTIPDAFSVLPLPYRLDAIGNWKGLIKYFLALPGALVWIWRTIRRLQREYEEVTCLFPGFSDRLSFSPLVKRLGCTLIWLEYGPLEPTFKRTHGFPKLLYAIARPYVDRVITISQHTKKSLIETGKINPNKIDLLYPGIKEVNPAHYRKQESRLRSKYKLGERNIVITIARLAHEKEIDFLIHAWVAVVKKKKNIVLIIVGNGPMRHELEELVRVLRIEKSVVFTGFIDSEEKRCLLSISSVFVFPSSWELEGFGMTTAEAMMMGVPVVTSGAGPQAEIVENGKTGVYIEPHTQQGLAKTIQKVLNTPTSSLGKKGRMRALKLFSISQMKHTLQKFSL
jgi:glycosyltransferase involved in cell wall biosynthesis